jgi:hypothetical protein
MRSHVRVSLVALLVCASVAVVASSAQAAVGIEKFVGVNCMTGQEKCGEKTVGVDVFGEALEETVEPTLKESEEQGYRQAGGHIPFGVSDFMVTHIGEYKDGKAIPTGIVTHVRTDVAAGLASSPAAVAQCTMKEFGETEAIPGTGFYPAPTCNSEKSNPAKDTVLGEEKATVYVKPLEEKGAPPDVALTGTTYNLVQPTGRSAEYGTALKLPIGLTKGLLEEVFKGSDPAVEDAQYYAHTLIEGSVEWGKEAKGTEQADYHDYFEVKVSPNLPLIRSRLETIGTSGNGAFLTNATRCPGDNTTILSLEGSAGEVVRRPYTTLLGIDECGRVPFEPEFVLNPETKQQDQPDGITTELTVPHFPSREVDSSQLNTAEILLPEGMTINPSAAGEVTEACTVAQARIHSPVFGVACPEKSKIGTVSLEVPTLPAGSLTGNVYLGGPTSGSETGPITGPPYTIYINAESTRYGVDVRLKGSVTPNETTGRLTATFTENPEQPFSDLKLAFNTGALAPVANPLTCGSAVTETSLTPYATYVAVRPPSSSFLVEGIGGGACPSSLPFALSQSVFNQPPGYAGAKTSYTLNIQRSDGQQYLSQIKTVMPAGLVGLLPTVTQCGEPQAGRGECPETSKIGRVNVAAGAGTRPYGFTGNVYLTGPYGGAPFGLSIVVPAIAGPFNLGNVVTRGTLNIEPYTARVVATSTLPTIVGGIPLRLKGISVEINKQGFLQNPTNCGTLQTETTLTSTLGATQTLSTPFQVSNCNKLAFKPAFGAATGAKTSKANGASLETTINMPAGDANIKSVLVQLPKQLPSRLTTLQKACPEATFAANPYHCPPGSFVGGVRANTPTLSVKMKGPAILVSHGGAAFPDLDLLLEGEGVRVILVGNTNIKNGITTTNFAAPPDVPVSSITVNLPVGGHSALSANGNLCANKLVMPTTIVGQNGTTFKQNTTIKVTNCPVRIVGQKIIGNTAYLSVQTYSTGRISGKGADLATVFRNLNGAQKSASLKVSLSSAGRRRGRPFSTKVRVGFVPKKKGAPSSVAYVTVRFG